MITETREAALLTTFDLGTSSLRKVRDKATPHQKAQRGADVRPEPLPCLEEGSRCRRA